MAQADSNLTTRASADSSRRRFLASAVGATALASAAMPTTVSQSFGDAELLRLEKQIFAERDAAAVYDDEVNRLAEIWQAESDWLDDAVAAGQSYLTSMERWAVVIAMPEAQEHERLRSFQTPHYARQDAMTERMFSIPATTAEGRRAKVSVLLGTLMEDDWLCVDDDSEGCR